MNPQLMYCTHTLLHVCLAQSFLFMMEHIHNPDLCPENSLIIYVASISRCHVSQIKVLIPKVSVLFDLVTLHVTMATATDQEG